MSENVCEYFEVKNFSMYQHYSNRNPPWVKLYYALLDDPEFFLLSECDRYRYIGLILVASRCNNRVKNNKSYLKAMLRINEEPDLTNLFHSGFLLACRKRHAISKYHPNGVSEKSRGEKSREEKTIMSGCPDKVSLSHQAQEILNFLNAKTNRSFRPFDASGNPSRNLEFIVARLKEGYSVIDLRGVIARKARMWLHDDKMNLYLRPQTLFNREKCAAYVGEQTPEEVDDRVS